MIDQAFSPSIVNDIEGVPVYQNTTNNALKWFENFVYVTWEYELLFTVRLRKSQ